jgi:uncharacterized protein YyaL (SSP411 family)
MTSPEGGFYAALDAESEGEEGKFQRWTKEELQSLLTPSEFEFVSKQFALQKAPNFEEKYYVLNIDPALVDERFLVNLYQGGWADIRAKLLAARDKRTRPLTDTKIVVADNGLMIAGLADTGRLRKKPQYIAAAKNAADFILTRMQDADGRLTRSFAGGQARFNAYLNDYAFFTYGLIALHRATGEEKWLQAAAKITAKQIELFADPRGGGFFFTSKDHETLIARAKEPIDGAVPAGNSVAAGNLIYLAQGTQQPDWLTLAEKSIQSTAGLLEQAPAAAPWMAMNVAELLDARKQASGERPPAAAKE